jgi:hypothetical protein
MYILCCRVSGILFALALRASDAAGARAALDSMVAVQRKVMSAASASAAQRHSVAQHRYTCEALFALSRGDALRSKRWMSKALLLDPAVCAAVKPVCSITS